MRAPRTASGRGPTGSTPQSSPTGAASSWSATRSSMRWCGSRLRALANYLVTGAAGFIGSQLADALAAGGHEVAGIDSFTHYYDARLKEENAARLDVRRLDLVRDELDLNGFDGVFHL